MSKIAIVGEAWGEAEEMARMPFVGPSGYELNRMLEEAGIERIQCTVTNVFNLRPRPTNDIENLCGPKGAVSHNLPPLRAGKYVLDQYLGELDRLVSELADCNPNIIIAMGNTAAWALLHDPRISKIRGTIARSHLGYKVLPTYHPAAILREWSLRHVTVLDLMKARRESEFPEVIRPNRTIFVPESLDDLETIYEACASAPSLAADIETANEQITCIGFAPSTDVAFVIPITDPRRGGSYWESRDREVQVWGVIRRILSTPVPKVFQNGLYDIHYIWRRYGIPIVNAGEDTMLLHHALMPESEKGLGFLGSVYTNEPSWKLMRARGKGTLKKEDN